MPLSNSFFHIRSSLSGRAERNIFAGSAAFVCRFRNLILFHKYPVFSKDERLYDATGREYRGGQRIEADAPLDTMPVFVRKSAMAGRLLAEYEGKQV